VSETLPDGDDTGTGGGPVAKFALQLQKGIAQIAKIAVAGISYQPFLFVIVITACFLLGAWLGGPGTGIVLAITVFVLAALGLWFLASRDEQGRAVDLGPDPVPLLSSDPLDDPTAAAIRAFWGDPATHELLFVVSPADVDLIRSGTQVHDWIGITELLFVLTKAGYRFRVAKANDVAEDLLRHHDIVSIGGPIPNRLSRFLLDRPGRVYSFGGVDGHAVIDCRSDAIMGAVTDIASIRRDFGILTRMPNPYNDSHNAIVAAGVFGWGTQAVLRLLSDRATLEFLLTTDLLHFQALCACDLDDRQIGGDPYLLDLSNDASVLQKTIVGLGRRDS
jgi:hypothetical protein